MSKHRRLLVVLCLVLLTAATAAAPLAAAAGSPTYVVKAGDTAWAIARNHGLTLSALITANHLRYPYIIYPGQVLAIPDSTPPVTITSPINGQTVTRTVTVTGMSDTFESNVVVRVRGTAGAILAQVSTLGGGMGTPGPYTATLTYTVPYAQWGSVEALSEDASGRTEGYAVSNRVYLSGPAVRYYTVLRGDWLVRIAARFGVSWRAISDANHLVNPNRIYPGQRLIIP